VRNEGPLSFDVEVDLDALQRLDPRLVALAHGCIDDDELDELLERAVEEPEVRRAVEAFWPLDDAARMASFARARAALAARARTPCQSKWSVLALPAGSAAFLAGVVAWVVIGITPAAPLPPYELEVRGGFRAVRAEPRALDLGRMTPAAPIDLICRPIDPIAGEARAAIFVVRDGAVRRLDAVPEMSVSGAARWKGRVADLLPNPSGPVEVVMAVRAGREPPSIAEVRRALDGERGRLRLARAEFVVESP